MLKCKERYSAHVESRLWKEHLLQWQILYQHIYRCCYAFTECIMEHTRLVYALKQFDMHDTPSEICMFRHAHSLAQMTGSSFLQQQRLHRAQGQKSMPLLSSMHRA